MPSSAPTISAEQRDIANLKPQLASLGQLVASDDAYLSGLRTREVPTAADIQALNAKVAALQQVIQCLKNAAGAGLNAGFCEVLMAARAGEHGCVGLTTDLTGSLRGASPGDSPITAALTPAWACDFAKPAPTTFGEGDKVPPIAMANPAGGGGRD
jgi:hypothetical protein